MSRKSGRATADHEMGEDEEVAPRPAALIESLRSFGYTPATAIADLVDNSITAGARHVAVSFCWAGPDSHVSIVDDGTGMTEDELRSAMRAGSSNPLDERAQDDLGRFGLGLKTASFSQARSLTVASATGVAGSSAIRRWDLDHVGRENRWSLLKTALPSSAEEIAALGDGPGTVVLWHQLDRIVDGRPLQDEKARAAFFAMVDRVKEHLEMVFHRFIQRQDLEVSVNGQVCRPWDPFLSANPATEKLPEETKQVSSQDGTTHSLTIQPYVLPHRSALTAQEHAAAAGPRGWNLQQGFYLYRADRLIVSGDWFDPGVKPEEHYKLARIRVEITQEMDQDWALDVRKSKGRPPSVFREDFRRIARATRDRAQDVYRHHGRRSVGQGGPVTIAAPVWHVRRQNQLVSYEINRTHPLIEQVLEQQAPGMRRRTAAILSLVERNVPLSHILSQGFADEACLLSGQSELEPALLNELNDLFEQLCKTGLPVDEVRAYLATVQPFDRMPELVDALERVTEI